MMSTPGQKRTLTSYHKNVTRSILFNTEKTWHGYRYALAHCITTLHRDACGPPVNNEGFPACNYRTF